MPPAVSWPAHGPSPRIGCGRPSTTPSGGYLAATAPPSPQVVLAAGGAALGFRAHSQSKLPLSAEHEPMSDIAAIDPIALDTAPHPHATIPPPELPTDQPEATGDEPAVIISLSSEATASMQDGPTTLSLDPDEVDYALAWAVGVTGFAANAARTTKANAAADGARSNEADVAADYGTAIAERGPAEVIGAAVGSPSEALYHAANLGIPILDSVNPDAARNGASPAAISIGAFTFTHGGSTYAVTPAADDRLVGTKDGQEWKTWQRADAVDSDTGTAVGSQTLESVAAERRASADEALSGIDVSA